MTRERRALIELIRSSTLVVRLAVERARFALAPAPGEWSCVGPHEQLAGLLEAAPDTTSERECGHPEMGGLSIDFLVRRSGEHAEGHAAPITAAVQGR